MDITFLGTASCYPTASRNVSCTLLRFDDGSVWMFDCGECSQVQFQKCNMRLSRVQKIFITHLHGDHLFGLPGMMCTLSNQVPPDSELTLEIFGPTGIRRYIRECLSLSRSMLNLRYVVHELIPDDAQYPLDWNEWIVNNEDDGRLHPQEIKGTNLNANADRVWKLVETAHVKVYAGALKHVIPTFGFVVVENDSPGTLDVEKLKKLQIPPGPLYGKIKRGEILTLNDGTVIDPASVMGPKKKGRKVTILGDTSDSSGIYEIARYSDVIVHEATLESALYEKAIEFGHSTPAMAVKCAEACEAKVLILFHFSQRYRQVSDESDQDKSVADLLEEAQNEKTHTYPYNIIAAHDLMTFQIVRPENNGLKSKSETRSSEMLDRMSQMESTIQGLRQKLCDEKLQLRREIDDMARLQHGTYLRDDDETRSLSSEPSRFSACTYPVTTGCSSEQTVAEYERKIARYQDYVEKVEADRRRQARRQLAASAYKRRLQQIERECNAELARVRNSAACLEPLNRIVSAWASNNPEDAVAVTRPYQSGDQISIKMVTANFNITPQEVTQPQCWEGSDSCTDLTTMDQTWNGGTHIQA